MGIEVPAFGDAHFATPTEIKKAPFLGDNGIRIGYYRPPGQRTGWGQVLRYSGKTGLLTIGPQRSGKQSLINAAVAEFKGSVIGIDRKAQFPLTLKRHREKIGPFFCLNAMRLFEDRLGPTAPHNPMAALDPGSRAFSTKCFSIAEGVIRVEPGPGAHWSEGARNLVTGLIGQLAAHGHPNARNLIEVRRILTENIELVDSKTGEITYAPLLHFVAREAMNSPHAFIRQSLARYADAHPKNPGELSSFVENAIKQTYYMTIEDIADFLRGDNGQPFRWSDMKQTPMTVSITLPEDDGSTSGLQRLLLNTALQELSESPKGQCKVLVIIDEFPTIGHLKIIEQGAATLAGKGVLLWPICQFLSQLKRDYPDGDMWEGFISGSEIRIFLGPNDDQTSTYISSLAGTRTVTTAGESLSRNGLFASSREGESASQAGQPLIRPHEARSMGPNEMLIIGPQNTVISGLRELYLNIPEFEGIWEPDPYHAGEPPPRPVNPAEIVTLADRAFQSEATARAVRAARRPLALRLLLPRASSDPRVNRLRKIEYALTLPLRLPLAFFALPFALHSRPVAAVAGIFALFGFWEIFNGVIKQPIVTLYEIKATQYQQEAIAANPRSNGDILYSHYHAAKWLIGFAVRELFGAGETSTPSTGTSVDPSATGFDGKVAAVSARLDREMKNGWDGVGRAISSGSGVRSHLERSAVGPPAPRQGSSSELARSRSHRFDIDQPGNAPALLPLLDRPVTVKDNTVKFYPVTLDEELAIRQRRAVALPPNGTRLQSGARLQRVLSPYGDSISAKVGSNFGWLVMLNGDKPGVVTLDDYSSRTAK